MSGFCTATQTGTCLWAKRCTSRPRQRPQRRRLETCLSVQVAACTISGHSPPTLFRADGARQGSLCRTLVAMGLRIDPAIYTLRSQKAGSNACMHHTDAVAARLIRIFSQLKNSQQDGRVWNTKQSDCPRWWPSMAPTVQRAQVATECVSIFRMMERSSPWRASVEAEPVHMGIGFGCQAKSRCAALFNKSAR